MTQNDAIKVFKCVYCTYYTKRHYDLKRHHNAKHKISKLIIKIGRAHVRTPVTSLSRMPSSA